MEQKPKIEPHLLDLINPNPEKFILKYHEVRMDYKKDEEAYEAVERLVKAAFGYTRYASFDSFRKVRDKKR